MIVIDEYLAVRVLLGHWPDQLPTDELGLPMTRHWRLLQAVHAPRGGQLSRALGLLPEPDRDAVRHPHPEVLQVLDPRPLLDDAAATPRGTAAPGFSSPRPWPRDSLTAGCTSAPGRTLGGSWPEPPLTSKSTSLSWSRSRRQSVKSPSDGEKRRKLTATAGK
jgi:hypothetical protein